MGSTPSTRDIKVFIIETLALEDLTPEDIPDDQSLFEGGLGLDSIDTLELGIALRLRYHVELEGDTSLRQRLGTVQAIAAFLQELPQPLPDAPPEKNPLAD